MKPKMMILSMVIAMSIAATSFTLLHQPKPWPVPDKNAKLANPVKKDDASLKAGKAVWNKDCASCHGKLGLGDGSKSKGLKTHPGDFSTAAFQGQTDGALFYKVATGRDDMPSFKKKIPDEEDIWSVVNYMRTFKK